MDRKNIGKYWLMAVLLTLLVGVSCHATSLQKADSLFASQRFTDARTMYSHAFFDEKKPLLPLY